MRRAFLPATVLVLLLLAGCGGGDDDETTTGPATAADEEAITDTIYTWIMEGDCSVATDSYLSERAGVEDPARACEKLEKEFVDPPYKLKDLTVSEVEVGGSEATAHVKDAVSGFGADYTLVNEDGEWKVDGVLVKF